MPTKGRRNLRQTIIWLLCHHFQLKFARIYEISLPMMNKSPTDAQTLSSMRNPTTISLQILRYSPGRHGLYPPFPGRDIGHGVLRNVVQINDRNRRPMP
jgi:hypothetical protein